MITVFVGHRGVGKSALLKRLSTYFPQAECIDLDSYIEQQEQRTIKDIFAIDGEASFRKLEQKYFAELLSSERMLAQNTEVFLAVGAGFKMKSFSGAKVIWLRRSSDAKERFFLDRPEIPYKARFIERERFYQSLCDEVFFIPEGLVSPSTAEEAYFKSQIKNLDAMLTILPGDFQRKNFAEFINIRLSWGISCFELRDDLLSVAQIERAFGVIPLKNILYSFRVKQSLSASIQSRFARQDCDYKIDWDVSLGDCPYNKVDISSLHERRAKESFAQTLRRLERVAQPGSHLKAALQTNNFAELELGHQWMQADLQNRSFLPCSASGRWSWYRLLMKSQSKLNFIREGDGSALDQPLMFDWCKVNIGKNVQNKFFAVLGDPVEHSFSPVFHDDFFAQYNLSSVAICVTKAEWQSGAMKTMQALGLQAAAVTAPLKRLAFASCDKLSDQAKAFKSVNTLFYDEKNQSWQGENFDYLGLARAFNDILKKYSQTDVAVWGGGGTLSMLRKLVPAAFFYSARTGENRSKLQTMKQTPQLVIWAAGDSGEFPDESWRPQVVLDLDYKQSSRGLQYAAKCGADYLSGLKMFFEQAKAQQEFWSKHVGK